MARHLPQGVWRAGCTQKQQKQADINIHIDTYTYNESLATWPILDAPLAKPASGWHQHLSWRLGFKRNRRVIHASKRAHASLVKPASGWDQHLSWRLGFKRNRRMIHASKRAHASRQANCKPVETWHTCHACMYVCMSSHTY